MNTLDLESTLNFLIRFHHFNDGLIRELNIAYQDSGQRAVSVKVVARDVEGIENDGWVSVSLILVEASDFCFADKLNTTAQVLSQGIHICWFDEFVGIELGDFCDAPNSLEEIKESSLFAVGRSLRWEVSKY